MRRVILVNGVPASGKSTISHELSRVGRWPLLSLDTLKEALFFHLGTGDRDYNRLLGRASYQAMFEITRDFPAGSTVVMDAWFGFQPIEVLQSHLERAGQPSVYQFWCSAPAETIGERYRARVASRSRGHLGLDYVPELIALAARASPLPGFHTLFVDTTKPFAVNEALNWLDRTQQ